MSYKKPLKIIWSLCLHASLKAERPHLVLLALLTHQNKLRANSLPYLESENLVYAKIKGDILTVKSLA